MLLYLILLFTALPLIELVLLLKIGSYIGIFNTISIVLFTGITGAYLAKTQGLAVLGKIQNELNMGSIPGDRLLDGVLILAGGILLLTPGFITDITGFATLIPVTRNMLRQWLKNRFKAVYARNSVSGDHIDIEYIDKQDIE
ncbi:MAG: FxsA family protein [Elusimicrobiota bacterium]